MQEDKHRTYDLILKLTSSVVVVITILIGIWQYREAAEREFKRRYWEKQLELYFEASGAASRLATSLDKNERDKERLHLYTLYHGPLIMVIDDEGSKALKTFVQLSIDYERDPGLQVQLQSLSRELAHVFRKSLANSKDVKLQDLDFSNY